MVQTVLHTIQRNAAMLMVMLVQSVSHNIRPVVNKITNISVNLELAQLSRMTPTTADCEHGVMKRSKDIHRYGK